MIVAIHHNNGKTVVAVCDNNLLGMKFEEQELVLDLSKTFYQGTEKNEEETGDLLRNADIINVVGEKSVAIALKEGIIDNENVCRVKNIPFAQAAILRD